MACSFAELSGSPCGAIDRMPTEGKEVVPLSSCCKDISSHLKTLKIPKNITSEVSLILSRVGDFSHDPKRLTICPSHRAVFGVGWKRTAERCQTPSEIAGHSSSKDRPTTCPKGDRGLRYYQSKKIYERVGVVVPMGSGMKKCTQVMPMNFQPIKYFFFN